MFEVINVCIVIYMYKGYIVYLYVWNVRYMCCMYEILKGKDLSKGKILVVFLLSWLLLCVFYKVNREILGRKIIIFKVSRWFF